MTQKILTIGAGGKFAGLVIPALERRGVDVRAFVHRPKDIEVVRGQGVHDVVQGDLADRAAVDAALKNVTSVFYVAPVALPDEAAVGVGAVDPVTRPAKPRSERSIAHSLVTRQTLLPTSSAISRAPL